MSAKKTKAKKTAPGRKGRLLGIRTPQVSRCGDAWEIRFPAHGCSLVFWGRVTYANQYDFENARVGERVARIRQVLE